MVNLGRVSVRIGNFDYANGMIVNYNVALMTSDLQLLTGCVPVQN